MLMAVKLFETVLHCIELIVPVIRHKRMCDIANAICACTCTPSVLVLEVILVELHGAPDGRVSP